MHYDIEQAGVWVDCVREQKPVIHNDYAALPHKKGIPEGHIEVVRELVVPVMREGKIVAILGVGNKATDYTEKDMEIVSYLADVTWEIVLHKQADEDVRRVAAEWQITFDVTQEAIWILDPDHRILRANKKAELFSLRVPGDPVGKYCWTVVHGATQPPPQCPVLRARKSLSRESVELVMGGRWIQVTVDPILDTKGGYAGAVHVMSDITERKRAETQLTLQAKIAAVFAMVPDEEMFHEVLKLILDETESPFGVFGYLDETDALVVPTMSRQQVWEECQVSEKSMRFPKETWGREQLGTGHPGEEGQLQQRGLHQGACGSCEHRAACQLAHSVSRGSHRPLPGGQQGNGLHGGRSANTGEHRKTGLPSSQCAIAARGGGGCPPETPKPAPPGSEDGVRGHSGRRCGPRFQQHVERDSGLYPTGNG